MFPIHDLKQAITKIEIFACCSIIVLSFFPHFFASANTDLSQTPHFESQKQKQPAQNIVIIDTMTLPLIQQIGNSFVSQIQHRMPNVPLKIERFNAQGDRQNALNIVRRINKLENAPDLIVSVATLATQAVIDEMQNTKAPVLFMLVADPVALNIVEEYGQLARENITGHSHIISTSKKVDFMNRVLVPAFRKQGKAQIALITSKYPSALTESQMLLYENNKRDGDQRTFSFINIQLDFSTSGIDIDKAKQQAMFELERVKDEVIGYWLPPAPLSYDIEFHNLVKEQTSLPLIFVEDVNAVRSGALVGLTASATDIANASVNSALKILSGSDANDIPVERLRTNQIAVNLSTAKQEGIAIPSNILRMANTNVYH